MNKKSFGLLAGVALAGFASSTVVADLPARQIYKTARSGSPRRQLTECSMLRRARPVLPQEPNTRWPVMSQPIPGSDA
jgi:hypothetical protein